jgi:hypothetical protein
MTKERAGGGARERSGREGPAGRRNLATGSVVRGATQTGPAESVAGPPCATRSLG